MPEYKVTGRLLALTSVSAKVRARGIEEAQLKARLLALEKPEEFEHDFDVSSEIDVVHVELSKEAN